MTQIIRTYSQQNNPGGTLIKKVYFYAQHYRIGQQNNSFEK